MSDQKTYSLVTGASNGIGQGLAEECALRGYNVLLVALPEPKLEEVCKNLKDKYPNQAFDSLGIDLMQKEAPQAIYDWCKERGYVVDKLMNNAGLGNSGAFETKPVSFYYGQMQLNMVSLVMLTHHFLEGMKSLPKAYVLNVGSMASFYDIPFKGIYAASKRFVYSFSRSLREELKDSNVSITVLCPAAVATNPDVLARTEQMGWLSKLTQATAEEVAKFTIDKLLEGKAVAIPGVISRFYKKLGSIMPSNMKLRILAKQFKKQQQ